MPAFYGGCAQGTFGCAGVLTAGRLTCAQLPPTRLVASVSAAEASSHLDATQRDLVLSVQHLVDMAKTQVEKTLSGFTAR
ncbi:DUF6124 family protein [Pseudomonas sp. D1HM]|uniref:DUF6124 family protein n=1 Tax=Pseudomonas sp. D1HM TaxID=1784816 RepID=UPI001DDA5AD4|nr:hypothetical protein [Pseudomonas sp. D1HM]